MLTAAGLATGLILTFMPGHAGPDPATTGLAEPPQPLIVLPGLALALIVTLAGGVSLGPENPIIGLNLSLAVLIGAAAAPRRAGPGLGGSRVRRHDRRDVRDADRRRPAPGRDGVGGPAPAVGPHLRAAGRGRRRGRDDAAPRRRVVRADRGSLSRHAARGLPDRVGHRRRRGRDRARGRVRVPQAVRAVRAARVAARSSRPPAAWCWACWAPSAGRSPCSRASSRCTS